MVWSSWCQRTVLCTIKMPVSFSSARNFEKVHISWSFVDWIVKQDLHKVVQEMHNDPADCNIHTRKLALSAHLMPRCQSYEFHEFHHFKLLQAVCHPSGSQHNRLCAYFWFCVANFIAIVQVRIWWIDSVIHGLLRVTLLSFLQMYNYADMVSSLLASFSSAVFVYVCVCRRRQLKTALMECCSCMTWLNCPRSSPLMVCAACCLYHHEHHDVYSFAKSISVNWIKLSVLVVIGRAAVSG